MTTSLMKGGSRLGTDVYRRRVKLRQIDISDWYSDAAHTLQSIDRVAKWFRLRASQKECGARVLLFNHEGTDTTSMLSLLHEELCRNHESNLTHVIFCSNAPFTADTLPQSSSLAHSPYPAPSYGFDHLPRHARVWTTFPGECGMQILRTSVTICDAVEYMRTELISKGVSVQCLTTGSLHLVKGLEMVLDQLEKNPAVPIQQPQAIPAELP